MSTHPITDIHDTEEEAKKAIDHAKKQNDKMILEAREKEEQNLAQFTEQGKDAGKEEIKQAKEEASRILKEEMSAGEKQTNSTIKEAEMRSDQAVRTAVKNFKEFVGLPA